MASLLDRCMFLSTAGGTSDFTVKSAVTGYMTPAQAGAVNATSYYYAAESSDKSQWEVGLGTYTVSGTLLARTSVLFSSNSNSKVSFSAAPNVFITLLAENLISSTDFGLAKVDGTTITAIAGVITAVSAGAGALVLLESHTASASATLDFTTAITSTYDEYLFEFLNLVPASNAVDLHLRCSTNGGSSYDASGAYDFALWSVGSNGGNGAGDGEAASAIAMFINLSNTSALGGYCGSLKLFNPLSASQQKQVTFSGNGQNGSAAHLFNNAGAGRYDSITAVNAVRFLFSSGNIASGIIRCYGISH